MGFSRQEYWSGLPFPSPWDLPDPGIEPGSPTLEADALTSEPPGKPQRKQRNSRKTYASLTTWKPLTLWITTNCGKFLKRWECQTTLPASWEICTQVKKQQLEPDMEQWPFSKLGKEYINAVYCHPAYLTSMQSTSWETLGWMYSWNQDCQEKYQQPQICRWYHPNSRKQRRTKGPLDGSERGEWKSWRKPQHSEN